MFCSPKVSLSAGGLSSKANSRTCFDRNALQRIAKTLDVKESKKLSDDQVWNQIRDRFVQRCGNDETCWFEQPELNQVQGVDLYHKPEGPAGGNRWLKT